MTPPSSYSDIDQRILSNSCLLFGVDFGTTFTGVAWVRTNQPENISIITKWESDLYGNREREKCPTSIHYGPDGTTWGYEIPSTAEPIQWLKLLLVNEDDLDEHLKGSPQLNHARELLKRAEKDAIEAVADFLRLLWDHVLTKVRESIGKRLVDITPFRVVLTIPAIWKTSVVARMRQAVKQAGILADRSCGQTTLSFITEPEAAALATFSDMKRRPDIEIGDAFVVADCGGGTVDLISYEVRNTEPLEFSECVEGTGALCGGIFLDQDFETLLRNRIGKRIWDQIPQSEIRKTMATSWEYGIKQQFDATPRNWPIDLPPQCSKKGSFPRITLESGHVEEVFENVTSQIEGLVGQQSSRVEKRLKKHPKYVILVGGFGCCRFLYKRLCTIMGNRSEVLQSSGPAPWTAVCRGAVLYSLISEGLLSSSFLRVSSRISRASFGVQFQEPFDRRKHHAEDIFYDSKEGSLKARHQMRWFLVRGEEVAGKRPTEVEYFCSYFENEMPMDGYLEAYTTIYTCEDLVPPTRRDPKKTNVKQLCKIQIRLPIPFSQLPIEENDVGQSVRRFYYVIEMTSHGASVEFSVNFQGQRLASENFDVLFEGGPEESD
ncbi:actin-like ATPase domain-containing protein [Hypomontagnella monticulosa]|nr:actin-like ATPase domain-containing protein [Hypomontagnella monticulosa]